MESKFMTDGRGIEMDKHVFVRERTTLYDSISNGVFYEGHVLAVVQDGRKPSPHDVVYVYNSELNLVSSTRRHCCYATKDALESLVNEIEEELDRKGAYQQRLKRELEGRYSHLQDAMDRNLFNGRLKDTIELCNLSDALIEKAFTSTVIDDYIKKLEEALDSVCYLVDSDYYKGEEKKGSLSVKDIDREVTKTVKVKFGKDGLLDDSVFKCPDCGADAKTVTIRATGKDGDSIQFTTNSIPSAKEAYKIISENYEDISIESKD